MIDRLAARLVADGYMKQAEVTNPLVIILRACSVPAVDVAVWLNLHPNFVTAISQLLGFIGAWLYFLDEKLAFILFWMASVILDYADGTVARKCGKESRFGYLFDMLGDRVKLLALILAWACFNSSWLAIGLSVCVLAVLSMMEVTGHLLVKHPSNVDRRDDGQPSPFYETFFSFNMHTFAIFGVGLMAGSGISLLVVVWLLVVLVINLNDDLHGRIFDDGRFSIRWNDALLAKLRWRGGKH
tara:strand:- start:21480 stop:22205 length:726 start_codon:yes stop_codon:yes gene_type:complete